VIPRLIAAPGFTYQQPSGLASIDVTAGGTGYTVAPTVTITPDMGAAAHAVLTGDAVSSVVLDTPGEWFDTPPTIDFLGDGTGAAATATLEVLANPVCSSLPGVLNKLIGMAVIGGPADSKQAFIDWRETLQSERLIPVASTVKITDANGVVQTRPSEGRVIGIGVRRDFEKNGKPFHSWANQAVQGIVGPNRFIEFSLTDGATEGQEILAANGGVILRGQYGVETAIASGGFVYVGTDTLSEDSLWSFYNVMRGRDYIHLMFLRTLRYYLGRFNLTGQTIQSVVNTMEFALRDLKADNHILGYKVGFSKDQNSPEQLRLGKFTVRFAAEEPPVLRRLVIQSARYRPALDALLDDLLTQLELA
jgi:phage tail sheath protein FI